MASVSTEPTYPVPGRQTSVTFTLTESGTNWIRVWCTAAPDGSALGLELDAGVSRIKVYENNGGSNFRWPYTFDKGGVYTLVAQEYTRNQGVGGLFEGDTDGGDSETKVSSESTLTVYVGQRFVQKLGTPADQADLVLWIWNDSVRSTTTSTHGEKSPDVQNPTSDAARTACASTDVLAAVTALTDSTVTGIIGSPSTISDDFVTKWNAHIADVTYHAATDTDNALNAGYADAGTLEGLQTFVGESFRMMRRHYTNDTGTSTDGGYHELARKRHDWTNIPLRDAESAAYPALAEEWRSFEAHRVTISVHSATDTANALSTLPPLLEVHRLFFAVLASESPTTPPTHASGGDVIVKWGFEEKAV